MPEPIEPAADFADGSKPGIQTRLRRAKWYLAGYWLLLVLATHWPNRWGHGRPSYPDKLVHFSAYAALAFLVVPVALGARPFDKRRFRVVGLLIWVAIVAFGLVDETTQPLTGRDFDWFDWLADSAGALCGLALSFAWFRHRHGVRRK